jgi:DNA polymerase-3 subunit epsilon
MKAVAIDFETATSSRDSACAVGLAWIESGIVTRREYRLIRPRQEQFHPMNIRVHGITAADVRGAPEFPVVFNEFKSELEGALVLAHNSSFDISVLDASLQAYGDGAPGFLLRLYVGAFSADMACGAMLQTLNTGQSIWRAVPAPSRWRGRLRLRRDSA